MPALAFGAAFAPVLAFGDFGAALGAAFALVVVVAFFVVVVVFAAMSVGSCLTRIGYL